MPRKSFEEALADLIDKHADEGLDVLISTMELTTMALEAIARYQQQEIGG